MTALKNFGMHVVFAFEADDLHRIVRHLFFLNYLVPAPDGYDHYCLTPARIPENINVREWSRQVLRAGTPEPEFVLPVHLDAEPGESPGGVDLEVRFGIGAYLAGEEVCVTVSYLGVTPDAEGVGNLLAARSPARWWIPLNWLSVPGLPIVPEAVATSFVTWSRISWDQPVETVGSIPESERYPAVAIGVALQDIPGAQPERFAGDIDLTENPATEYVALLRDQNALPHIALSTEVASKLLDLFVEEILNVETDRDPTEGSPFGIDEFDYEITGLTYEWPALFGDPVTFTANGRIHFLGAWRDMAVTSEVELFTRPRESFPNRKLQMYLQTRLPENLRLIHEPELEPELQRVMGDNYRVFSSQDAISPSANFVFRPDGLGRARLLGNGVTPFEFIIHRDPLTTTLVDFDPDTAAIEADKDALEIEFTYHYAGPLLTCSGGSRPWVDADENRWSAFRVSNTGGIPVGIAVTTDRPDLLYLRGGTRTLPPGEAVDVSVEFRTDALPRFYRSDAQKHFDANIYVRHSVCNREPIPVTFSADVTYDLRRGTISDAERNALCGFADAMMFKYGIVSLGDDRFDEHPDYAPVYTMSIRDEEDQYAFVARDEEGNPVATEAAHSLYKTMQIPVSEDESLPLEVRYRASQQPAKGPFYWTLRGFAVEPAAEVKIEGLKALAPFSGGAVAVGPAGVFLLDTTAPKRSAARLALKDEQSLVDVASSRSDIYAVGDDRLLVMNVSGEGKIKVVQGMTLGSSAHLIRQLGRRLWVAGEDEFTLLTHQHGKEIEQVATTRLKSPARDISVYRGHITLLVDSGLHFYAFDGSELKFSGTYNLKGSSNATLVARGELVGVTDPEIGTFFLDVSHGKEPEVVARYAQPYWKSNLVIDATRGITYSADPRSATAKIGRFRVLKIRR